MLQVSFANGRVNESVKLIRVGENHWATVDAEDFLVLSQHRWHLNERSRSHGRPVFYASTYVKGPNRSSTVFMHRMIAGSPSCQVDHRDGDGLNNRRSNLRLATASQNRANKCVGSKCGMKGVSFHEFYDRRRPAAPLTKRVKPWRACITVAKKPLKLGYFSTREEAGRAYDEAARNAFGEFACVNFPRPGERSALTGEILSAAC